LLEDETVQELVEAHNIMLLLNPMIIE